jgi:hypothetical protein
MEIKSQKFDLGRTLCSSQMQIFMNHDYRFKSFVCDSLSKHKTGDWGDTFKKDWKRNDLGIEHGTSIFSVYNVPYQQQQAAGKNKKIWITTAADRSKTEIIFPSEY